VEREEQLCRKPVWDAANAWPLPQGFVFTGECALVIRPIRGVENCGLAALFSTQR